MEVLISILKTGRLWSSNLRYLNDSSEVKHVIGIIGERLDALTSNPNTFNHQSVASLKSKLAAAMKANVFITCFSESKDDLSQWRGYAPEGCGVCIGFSSSALQKAAQTEAIPASEKRHNTVSFLTNVIYVDKDSGPTFDLIIEDMLNERPETSPKPSTMLALSAPFYKNSSFQDEREWRIVTRSVLSNLSQIQYRVGKSTLVPYLELNLKSCEEDFISEVIVGPSPNIDLSVEALQQMMDGGMKNVVVTPSDIPYRHW
jgi:hypothetical protein